jgi:ATP-binding cassette subfamily B protein
MRHNTMGSYIRTGDERPKITWSLLLRVLTYARPYWRHMVGMLVAILLSTGLSLLAPLLLRNMIDKVLPAKDYHKLVLLAVGMLMIPVLNGVIGVFQRQLNVTVGEGVIYDLRSTLYGHLQRMSLRFFTNTRTGELLSRLNNDVVGAQTAISSTIVGMITNLVQTISILAVMFSLEWRLTFAGVLILPLFLFVTRKLAVRLRKIAQQQMEITSQMYALQSETLNIGGALLIKLFGRAKDEQSRFMKRASAVRDMGIKRAVITSIFFVLIGLVGAVGTAFVYGVGGYLVIQGSFTIGSIVAFGSYLGQLYSALQGLANAPVDFSTSVVSFERVFEVVDLPEDIVEKSGAIALENVRGEIEFDNVSFTYSTDKAGLLNEVKRYGRTKLARLALSDEDEREITKSQVYDAETKEPEAESLSQARYEALDSISFHASPGQLVALVGPSGAGKTTLTYLIPRLYDPTNGCIRLDGHDLRDVSLSSLSTQIGMVTQENYLFHDTIRTNLIYAKLDASQQEIMEAASAANIHQFIQELPEGYNTVVGERGYRLSGGEKQRIALARVILKNPRILVLDEATSHLDSDSEVLIQEALKRVMSARTSIVIAHRLSTILAADLILVMDRGRIVEQGSHQELHALGGLYAHLYETQFKRR